MNLIKRIILFLLIIAGIVVYQYFKLPAVYEGDNYHLEGTCVETYLSGRKRLRGTTQKQFIVLDNGLHYQLYGSADIDNFEELEGKEISCFVSAFGFDDVIFAFDQGDPAENEKYLEEIKKDEIGRLTLFVAFVGFLFAFVIFFAPAMELWDKCFNKANKKDMLKRRKLKREKRQMQAEKRKNLEFPTQERHKQNKNTSKKKQEKRKKQDKSKTFKHSEENIRENFDNSTKTKL
jgi:hypothetical protein